MLIDSNILIYALNTDSQKHVKAKEFLQSRSSSLIFAQQNIFETLRIITHSKFSKPFPTKKALDAIMAITEDATILSPDLETQAIAFELIKKYKVKGTEIFDAYLVATALTHQINTIVTDNVKHLRKYKEINVFNPFY